LVSLIDFMATTKITNVTLSTEEKPEHTPNGLPPVKYLEKTKTTSNHNCEVKKEKKKKKKKKEHKKSENLSRNGDPDESNQVGKVEIEYVVVNPLEELNVNDPNYEEFSKIFQRFTPLSLSDETEGSKGAGNYNNGGNDQEEDRENNNNTNSNGKNGIGGDINENGESSTMNGNNRLEDEEDDEEQKTISKKEKKRQKRLSISVLKQLVKRPELVEAWDVTSADPLLLVHLKSYRNSVPVPRHWNQKRKYLQGKRGIEKPPFSLPDFIAATGISKIRAAIEEKEEGKKVKQKQRERMQPKMHKMDIDYQVLHDAFFKYQTKPKLTMHGDLYFEGKEFEVTLRSKRPGILSDELRQALGMPEGAPPPWLINMQRFGPPPAYPNLRVPGVNAPIPEGARWGYHPGGWGKPAADEYGRPIYPEVLAGTNGERLSGSGFEDMSLQPIERRHWGELEEEPEEEPEVAVEEGLAEDATELVAAGETVSGLETPSGLATPSGLETPSVPSGLSTPSGMETPETLELRKAPPSAAARESTGPLFQVLEPTETMVGNALYGSAHRYVLPGALVPSNSLVPGMGGSVSAPRPANQVDLMKSQATEKIDITLNPSEVENLEELSKDILLKKYEHARAEKQQQTLQAHEDVSDMVAEQLQKKRKKKDDKDSKSLKKLKEFKF